jgi:hypothetical protein
MPPPVPSLCGRGTSIVDVSPQEYWERSCLFPPAIVILMYSTSYDTIALWYQIIVKSFDSNIEEVMI